MLDLIERDRCFVIAEAGTNHAVRSNNEYHDRRVKAQGYIVAASKAGADAVKFQMFNIPIKNDMFCFMEGDEARAPRWIESYMPLQAWKDMKQYAEDYGIMFLASVFQHSTVRWLNELEVEATKVASRAAKDFPYGKSPEPYLVSAGMYDWDDYASNLTKYRWCRLQCEAKYPSTAIWEDSWTDGFSDHSGTPWRAIDAIRGGASIVEVHFYINEEDAGPDLPASLNLDQLSLVCEARDAFAEMNK